LVCHCFSGKIGATGLEPATDSIQTLSSKELTANHKTSLPENTEQAADLQRIIAAWPELPEHIKTTIKTLVNMR
jgi:hypothetical protein